MVNFLIEAIANLRKELSTAFEEERYGVVVAEVGHSIATQNTTLKQIGKTVHFKLDLKKSGVSVWPTGAWTHVCDISGVAMPASVILSNVEMTSLLPVHTLKIEPLSDVLGSVYIFNHLGGTPVSGSKFSTYISWHDVEL
jgi:hypothetical protein